MKFSDDLRKLEKYPFHMPGHKRSDKFGIVGSEIDITEIDGADNLHDSHGNILEIENALAEIYKSKKIVFDDKRLDRWNFGGDFCGLQRGRQNNNSTKLP